MLYLLEVTIKKKVNKINNELQQYIHSNKEKENQKKVDKITKRIETNKAFLMGKCPLDENLEEYQLRYQQVEKEQTLIKKILQEDL